MPHVLSYATSFIVIGVIRINHHALFHFIKRVDRTILVINLLLLMCVAFIPYPTALIGEYGSSLPVVVFYGLSLAILDLLITRSGLKLSDTIYHYLIELATNIASYSFCKQDWAFEKDIEALNEFNNWSIGGVI